MNTLLKSRKSSKAAINLDSFDTFLKEEKQNMAELQHAKLSSEGVERLCFHNLKIDLYKWIRNFQEDIRFSAIGLPEVGKSASMLSWRNALAPYDRLNLNIFNVSQDRTGASHTVRIKELRYRCSRNSSFILWDTPGIKREFEERILRGIINGTCGNEEDFSGEKTESLSRRFIRQPRTILLYVFKLVLNQSPQEFEEEAKLLTKVSRLAEKADKQVFVVLTCLDLLEGQEEAKLRKLADFKSELSGISNVPVENMFGIANAYVRDPYAPERIRDADLKVLQMIISVTKLVDKKRGKTGKFLTANDVKTTIQQVNGETLSYNWDKARLTNENDAEVVINPGTPLQALGASPQRDAAQQSSQVAQTPPHIGMDDTANIQEAPNADVSKEKKNFVIIKDENLNHDMLIDPEEEKACEI